MPFGLARYKNNKYFKTESGAFGGRVRLLSKKDSISYEPLIYKFHNKECSILPIIKIKIIYK